FFNHRFDIDHGADAFQNIAQTHCIVRTAPKVIKPELNSRTDKELACLREVVDIKNVSHWIDSGRQSNRRSMFYRLDVMRDDAIRIIRRGSCINSRQPKDAR